MGGGPRFNHGTRTSPGPAGQAGCPTLSAVSEKRSEAESPSEAAPISAVDSGLRMWVLSSPSVFLRGAVYPMYETFLFMMAGG